MMLTLALTPVQRIMFCTALYVRRVEAFLGHQLRGKFRAAVNVRDRVFRARAFGIISLFKVAGVVQENGEQPELEYSLRKRRLRAGPVRPAQQPRHAKGALAGYARNRGSAHPPPGNPGSGP